MNPFSLFSRRTRKVGTTFKALAAAPAAPSLRRRVYSVPAAVFLTAFALLDMSAPAPARAGILGSTNELNYIDYGTRMWSLADPFGFGATSNLISWADATDVTLAGHTQDIEEIYDFEVNFAQLYITDLLNRMAVVEAYTNAVNALGPRVTFLESLTNGVPLLASRVSLIEASTSQWSSAVSGLASEIIARTSLGTSLSGYVSEATAYASAFCYSPTNRPALGTDTVARALGWYAYSPTNKPSASDIGAASLADISAALATGGVTRVFVPEMDDVVWWGMSNSNVISRFDIWTEINPGPPESVMTITNRIDFTLITGSAFDALLEELETTTGTANQAAADAGSALQLIGGPGGIQETLALKADASALADYLTQTQADSRYVPITSGVSTNQELVNATATGTLTLNGSGIWIPLDQTTNALGKIVTITETNTLGGAVRTNFFSQCGILKTGVTVSSLAGDDGYWKAGMATPNPIYTVMPDGITVRDNLSGLFWTKNCNVISNTVWSAANGTADWTNCVVFATNLNALAYGGRTDWRLANKAEFASLANKFQWLNPGISDATGTNQWTAARGPWVNLRMDVATARYWTSTPYTIAGFAWYADPNGFGSTATKVTLHLSMYCAGP